MSSSSSVDTATAPAPEPGRPPGFGLSRFLYTHNPFYLISALLALRGAPLLFPPGEESWALLGLLAAYTALLTATAIVVIRFGRVWNDARSILLVLVLLFVAISTSFDQVLLPRFRLGTTMLLAALGFCVACAEVVLRATRIRMGPGYRIPLYALLGLFFVYPPLLAGLLSVPARDTRTALLAWGVVSFPALAAAISLTLIPAIRRSAAAAEPSGTPWRWPWFPLTPFVFLALGVAARAYWLTLAFYPGGGASPPFGLYFLAPLVLAAGLLVLEGGVATRSAGAVRVGLLAPCLAVFLALDLGPASADRGEFLRIIGAPLGSPWTVAIWAAVAFYGWALARGVRSAGVGVVAFLLLASVVGGQQPAVLEAPRALPLLLLAAAAAVRAIRRPSTARALLAHLACVLAMGTALPAGAALALQLGLAGAIAIGFLFDDDLALVLRAAGAYALAAAFALALRREALPLGYAAAAFALPPAVWLLQRDAHWFRALTLNCGSLLAAAGGAAYGSLGGREGGALLFWAALSFIFAALTTAAKAGGLAPALARLAVLADLGSAPRDADP